jgi:hypothetical protein
MKKTVALLVLALALPAFAEEDNAIKKAMQFAHKAPQGEKKLNEKIAEGTATEAEIQKALDLYKAMADTKPPRGDQAAFQEKVGKVIVATEELVAKKSDGVAHYKEAINCKACHSDHKPPQK